MRDISDRKLSEATLNQKSIELASFTSNLKQLHRISTTNYKSFVDLFADYLKTGCKILGLSTGMIAQIQEQCYIIRAVHSNIDFNKPQVKFALKDTYCNAVVKEQKTITHCHVGSMMEMQEHQMYKNLKLESYIGTPIFVNGQIYGTLNFYSGHIREQEFKAQEKEIIELMAIGIGQSIEDYFAEIERKQAEAALRESEERFRTMADSAPVLIWMSDVNKKNNYFNQCWLDFTGRSLEQEIGNGWTEGIHPSDLESFIHNYTQAFEARESFVMEYRLRRYDGKYLWILNTGKPRFLADGSFAGYIGSCVDIAERKKAEKLLKKANVYLENQVAKRTAELVAANNHLHRRTLLQELLLQLSNQFINLGADEIDREIDRALQIIAEYTLSDRSYLFLLSEDGKTLSCSHWWESEAIPSLLAQYQNLPVDSSSWMFKGLRNLETIHIPSLAELLPTDLALKAGSLRTVKSFLFVPVVSRSQLVGLIGFDAVQTEKTWTEDEIALLKIAADIFINALNRKQTENLLQLANQELILRVQELDEANKELDRSNQELENFAYIASHDLQEPLRKIKSFTDLLVEDYQGQLDAAADKYITYISDGAIRMQNLINDLLTYSRVGRGELSMLSTDLGEIIRQVLSDLSVSIEENNAVITHNSMPMVRVNPQEMAQLFQNLISNGIKFRRDVAPRIHIEAQLDKQRQQWLISIRDNGIGIKPEFTERIFKIFQRLHNRTKYPGTGIGLAICKKIVERHCGLIWVESKFGVGSTFYFTLPIH